MAEETDADALIILTSVEKVKINMDRPEEEELGEISVAQAKEYMEEGHFGKRHCNIRHDHLKARPIKRYTHAGSQVSGSPDQCLFLIFINF